jgi:CheY-like chemotaxis protein
MGSDLHVSSSPGQGSRFWLDLLLPERMLVASENATPRRIVGVQGRHPRILIIDDHADNRAILVKYLAPLGFDVAEAATAAEGLASAAADVPEAIIVDLRLPDSSGIELIRHLRQQHPRQETCILVSSASVFAEDWHHSQAAGADAFLPKPVRFEHLLEILKRHLNLAWSYAEDVPPQPEADPPEILPAQAVQQLPASEAVTRLYELAMMGHAAALREQAAELAHTDTPVAPLAADVERLARAFQINEACTLLEHYLERETNGRESHNPDR